VRAWDDAGAAGDDDVPVGLEYRVLLFPTALGDGIPLFSPKAAPVQLRLVSAEASGPAILARYERLAR
jgi:hypothetical protein